MLGKGKPSLILFQSSSPHAILSQPSGHYEEVQAFQEVMGQKGLGDHLLAFPTGGATRLLSTSHLQVPLTEHKILLPRGGIFTYIWTPRTFQLSVKMPQWQQKCRRRCQAFGAACLHPTEPPWEAPSPPMALGRLQP